LKARQFSAGKAGLMVRASFFAASAVALGLVLGVELLGVEPADAQFGGLFGAPPPRPPSSVPQQQPSGIDPGTGQVLAPIQSQSLPPPGDLRTQQGAQPGAGQFGGGQPTGQRPPLRPPISATSVPQPEDDATIELPSQKIANPTAVFAGLDKITGRIISFDVAINETVQFGALRVTPRVCYTRPPTETPNTDGFLEVDEVTLQGEVKRIFTGWMFAASPGLHAVEHPIYDVWLTDCKGGASTVAAVQPTVQQPTNRAPAKPAQTQAGAPVRPPPKPTPSTSPTTLPPPVLR
jgi:hypothetical protein